MARYRRVVLSRAVRHRYPHHHLARTTLHGCIGIQRQRREIPTTWLYHLRGTAVKNELPPTCCEERLRHGAGQHFAGDASLHFSLLFMAAVRMPLLRMSHRSRYSLPAGQSAAPNIHLAPPRLAQRRSYAADSSTHCATTFAPRTHASCAHLVWYWWQRRTLLAAPPHDKRCINGTKRQHRTPELRCDRIRWFALTYTTPRLFRRLMFLISLLAQDEQAAWLPNRLWKTSDMTR